MQNVADETDISRPSVIAHLNDFYQREKVGRFKCNTKHQETVVKAATLFRKPTEYFENDALAHNVIRGMALLTSDHVSAGFNRKKVPMRDGIFIAGTENLRQGHSIPEVGLGNPKDDPRLVRPKTDLTPDPVMRPVDPKLNRQLYKIRLSAKPNREHYLDQRLKLNPEEKYYFAECTNWDYGWRFGDSKVVQGRRQFGRVFQVKRTIETRTGPQPDPIHYKTPDSDMLRCPK